MVVAYTSSSHAGSAQIALATEHRETELCLRASGVPSVILRNSWYLENYTGQLSMYLEQGGIAGSAGEGRVSAATRADYAEAAAVVLTTEGHAGSVYELGGDEAFSLPELAAVLTTITGLQIAYTDLPASDFAYVLAGAGLPQAYADLLADADQGLGRGELLTSTHDLSRLLGRPTTTLSEAITAALAEILAR